MISPPVYRFGIVGTGAMAVTMMECFSLCSRVKVVAVGSRDLQRAREFAACFAIDSAHADLAAMLGRKDLNAIYIANAAHDHAATAIAALAAGKAVLCEKPFATSSAQGSQVAAAAAEHQQLFMEAQWTPFLPAFRKLLDLLQTRELGAPMHLRSEFGQSLDEVSHPHLFKGDGAGALLDFGVYPIMLALQVLGPVASVRALLRYNAAGVDVQAALQLAHRGGGQSQLVASLIGAMPNISALSCRYGTVRFDSPVSGAESLLIRRTSTAQRQAAALEPRSTRQRIIASLRRHSWLRRINASFARDRRSWYPYGRNRYLPQLSHFISLLDAKVLKSEVMPIDISLDALRVIDSARLDSPFCAERMLP